MLVAETHQIGPITVSITVSLVNHLTAKHDVKSTKSCSYQATTKNNFIKAYESNITENCYCNMYHIRL